MPENRKTEKASKKVLPVHMSETTWEKLRKIAFDKQISMNELCREGIDYIIKKYSNRSK